MITFKGFNSRFSGGMVLDFYEYDSGHTAFDKPVLLRHVVSHLHGVTLDHWTAKLYGPDPCWTGPFSSARAALTFFCPRLKRKNRN